MDPLEEDGRRRRRHLFALCDNVGLDRDERIEFAEMFLKRDVGSFKSLTDGEVVRLIDAFNGFALLSYMLSQRV